MALNGPNKATPERLTMIIIMFPTEGSVRFSMTLPISATEDVRDISIQGSRE